MKFEWFDICEIVNTGDRKLDGRKVVIDGVAVDHSPMSGTIWIVRDQDGYFFEMSNGKWKSIVMSESCLEKVA